MHGNANPVNCFNQLESDSHTILAKQDGHVSHACLDYFHRKITRCRQISRRGSSSSGVNVKYTSALR